MGLVQQQQAFEEAAARGKYRRLFECLKDDMREGTGVWRASFTEIERVLGFPLPKSARRHPAWWANEKNGRHTHARAWIGAGWKTEDVDIAAESVTFRRWVTLPKK